MNWSVRFLKGMDLLIVRSLWAEFFVYLVSVYHRGIVSDIASVGGIMERVSTTPTCTRLLRRTTSDQPYSGLSISVPK